MTDAEPARVTVFSLFVSGITRGDASDWVPEGHKLVAAKWTPDGILVQYVAASTALAKVDGSK